MSAMLSSFIYRSVKASKRKGKHLNIAIRRVQSPPSPASFMSPEIMDINEKSFAPSSPLVPLEEESFESYDSSYNHECFRSNMLLELSIPNEPMSDWFTHDMLGSETAQVEGESQETLNGVVCMQGGSYDTREAFVFSSDYAYNQPDEVISFFNANFILSNYLTDDRKFEH